MNAGVARAPSRAWLAGIVGRIAFAAGLAFAAALLSLAPNGLGRPLLGAFGPGPAAAICSPDPRADGYLTTNGSYNSTGSGPTAAGDLNSATVYAYLATLNGTNDGGSSGQKNCGNPVYRYGGLAWLTNSTTATLDWGAFTANGNSSACYPIWGTSDYMHANSTTTCVWTAGGNPGINYHVLAITLAPSNQTYRRNSSLTNSGDFEFIFNSCSTFYQDASGTGEVLKTGVAKSSLGTSGTQATIGPGANCGSVLTQDDTGYAQSFDYDITPPSVPAVSNNAASFTNTYAATPSASTVWVNSSSSGTITLTPSGSTDNLSGLKNYTFGTMSGTTTGWSPTTSVSQTGGRGYSWTSGAGDGQVATVAINANDNSGNASGSTTITLRGDEAVPTATFSNPPIGTSYQQAGAIAVTWSDSDPNGGAGIASRSLQRQMVAFSSGCGTFGNDGAPYTGVSPNSQTLAAVGGLATCYRWQLTLTDHVGNTSVTTSGTVIVDTTQPTITWNTPAAAIYNTTGSLTPSWTLSDPESGIASAGVVTRQYTTLAADTCGTSWTDDAAQANNTATTLINARCYRWNFTTAPVDGAGLAATTNLISSSVKVDTTQPVAPTVVGTGAGVYTSGSAIYFNNTVGGTLTLTSTGSDPETGVASSTFGIMGTPTTGWTYTSGSVNGNPATRSLVWTAGAASGKAIGVTVTNAAGTTSSTSTVTLTQDANAPAGTFSAPVTGTSYQTTLSLNVSWSETETGSGIASRGLQRQIAVATSGSCGTFANDAAAGNSSTAGSPVSQTLVSGNCYRWVETLTDNVGLSSSTTSGILIPDTSAPAAPSVIGTGTGVFTSGSTIYFNNNGGGTATLTSTGSDPESGIASSTFGSMNAPTTGWTYSFGTVAGNPAVKTAAWTTGAADNKTMSVSTTNNAGAVSPSTSVTFLADTSGPSGTYSIPAAGTAYQTGTGLNVAWSESDPGSGVGSRSLQRQVATLTNGSCGAYANDTATGNLSTAPSPVSQTLASGSCYRWVLTITDNVGNVGSPLTSGAIVVDATPPTNPTVTDNSPAATYRSGNTIYFQPAAGGTIGLTSTSSDPDSGIAGSTFGSLSSPTGWTYTPSFVLGNPATTSLTWSTSAGSATLPVSATNGAGAVSAATQLTFTADGAGPAIGSLLPAAGTASQTSTSVTVSWTESDNASGIASRSLQRQKASAFSASSCASATYTADGAAQTGASPDTDSGLLINTCYRWQLSITDRVGNVSVATSGIVFIYEVPVSSSSAMRTATVGEAVWFVVGLYDSHGQPLVSSNYSGTVCLSASAGAGAEYPDGSCASLSIPGGVTGHSFRVLLGSVGTYTLTASGSGFTSSSVDVAVSATTLVTTAPTTAYVGIPMTLKTAAHRSSASVVADYNGNLTFSSSDSGLAYGGGIDGNHQYRMTCGCEDGHPFELTFANTGTQTVTVQDEFGNLAQVSVNVLAAPGGIGVPSGFAAYAVQWQSGHTVDYYIQNLSTAQGLRVVDAYTTCSAPGDPQHTAQDLVLGPYNTLTVRLGLIHCWIANSGTYDGHHLIIADSAGHKWDVPVNRYYRFVDVPGSANFNEVDEGDPLIGASLSVTSKSFSPVDHPVGAEGVKFSEIRNGLSVAISASRATPIIGFAYPGQPANRDWGPEPAAQYSFLAAGTTALSLDYLPWGCYFGADSHHTLKIHYGDEASGRDGTANFEIGDPGVAAPSDWCNSPNGGNAFDANGSEELNNPLSLDNWLGAAFDTLRNTAGDPVDTFTGSQTAEVTDFTLGGLTPSLSLTRSYRSNIADALWRGRAGAHAQQLLFGPGWGSLLDTNLEFPTATAVDVRTADGYYRYAQRTDGSWSASNRSTDVLAAISGGWAITHLDGSGFRFDSGGRLAAIFDANGRELVLTWVSGKISSMTDPAGRTASFTTDSAGRITRADLPGTRYVAFTFDANGYLHTARDLGGTVLTYNADVRGRIASVQNVAGDNLLRNVFDDSGRVVVQYNALNAPTFFNYDDFAFASGVSRTWGNDTALIRTVIDPRGAATVNCYGTKGTQVGAVDPVGGIRTWTYDFNANPTRSVDERGYVTTAKFNGSHEPIQVVDALGHATNLSWDSFGHPASVSTGASNSTTAFDPTTHLPLSITTSDGTNSVASATYTYYAGTNLLKTATGLGGTTTTYHYDADGYVDSIIDPEGRKTTFVTDPNTGLLTSTVDALGNAAGGVPGDHTTSYTYDGGGRALTITDALGNMAGGTPSAHRTSYTYDSFGRVKTISRASGSLATYNYDLAGRITSLVVKLDATHDATTAYEYDESGNLSAVTDAENRRTETTYDLASQPVSVKDSANKVSTIAYDKAGEVVSTTDATGVTRGIGYDALGRITRLTDGANKDTTYAYDAATGLLNSATDPLTHATNYGYDWLGRLTSVTNAKNQTSSVTYNVQGSVASATNARNKTTSFTYNNDGQLLTVTEPGDAGNIVTTYTYDPGGRLHTRQNDRGALDTYDYDALGRPIRLTDSVSKVWQTVYTNDGQIDHTIDGKSQTTTFAYDLAGRLLTVTPANPTPAITYVYDETDRVLSMADGAGTTTYGYDTVGRLSSVGRGGRTVTYAYDDAGRPKTITYPASLGSVAYAYDTAGRLWTITDWASRVTTYHYDDSSRTSFIDRPGGLTTSYGYDEVDRPLSAVSTRSGATVLSQAWTYDPNGNIATLTDDTGSASFTYDNLDRLLTASYPGSQNYSYTYDTVGNMTQAVTPTGTATYAYDLADRITSAGPPGVISGAPVRPPSTNDSGWTSSANAYALDATYATAAPAKNQTTTVNYGTFGFGAALPANATVTNVTVSVTWKVSTASSIATLGSQLYVAGTARGTELTNATSPTSDLTQTYTVSGLTRADLLDGTLTIRARASRGNSNTTFTASLDAVSVTASYTAPGPSVAPTYDDNGNMTSDGSYGSRAYAYDTLGRLTSVTGGASTTTYTLDGSGNRRSQTTGGVTTTFDLDLMAGNATILYDGGAKYLPGAAGAGYEAGGLWHTALTDLIGSAVLFVDTAGVTSGLTHYDPYGAPRSGSTASVGIGYAGEYRDATGLVNMRARSYDPVLGRFIGRDTFAGVASAPQTGNRYAYAVANPLRFSDPSGHFIKTVIENPASVLEFAMTFNPIGAALVFSYSLITGTDPATGVHIDRTIAGIALIAVTAIPVVKFFGKGIAALTRGLGETVGGVFERFGQFGSKIGGGLGRLGQFGGTVAGGIAHVAEAVGGFVTRVGSALAGEAGEIRLGGVAGEVGAAQRTVVVGRNMTERVIPYAERGGFDYYRGTPGWVPRSIRSVAPGFAKKIDLWFNGRWINNEIKAGSRVVDIGEPAGMPSSDFYNLELRDLEGYWNYVQDIQP